jgi:carboxymethylenebutenolidase
MTRSLVPVLVIALLGCSAPQDDYTDRMAAEHEGDAPVASWAVGAEPASEVRAETVTYGDVTGRPVIGFLARPARDAEGAPGIIVIHEWWGLNDNIRDMTRQLAGLGYNALAVDLYRGEVAEDSDGARGLMSGTMEREAELETNLRSAYRYLADELSAPAVGTIGWCFGGGWSLRTALLLPDEVDATVIYYGRLVTERERLEPLQMPILGIFGAEDQGIPVDTVREFESTLKELGKSASVHVYEGANHAFANPSGTRYNDEAAEDAWSKTTAFFAEHLRP